MEEAGNARPPRLLEQVKRALRVRHYSIRTEEAYVAWIRRFILFHHKRHPSAMGAEEINAFLTHLATEGRVAASTQNQALSAILFLYKYVLREEIGRVDVVHAKRPGHRPGVLTREEVAAVLGRLEGTWWMMGMLLYGSGLRQIECLRLRVKDVDLKTGEVMVRDGKGEKDRMTTLSQALDEPLGEHIERLRELAGEDRKNGVPGVWLPYALEKKYPNSGVDGPCGCVHDDELHARAQPPWETGHPEPGGPDGEPAPGEVRRDVSEDRTCPDKGGQRAAID